MQYAFRGHLVAIINENTASDGEALAYGLQARNGIAAMGSLFCVSSSPFECNFDIGIRAVSSCPSTTHPFRLLCCLSVFG